MVMERQGYSDEVNEVYRVTPLGLQLHFILLIFPMGEGAKGAQI